MNDDITCNSCEWYLSDSPHGRPTYPSKEVLDFDIYKDREIVGFCDIHRNDLFVTTPCGAWRASDA